jgi:hypothetical protein
LGANGAAKARSIVAVSKVARSNLGGVRRDAVPASPGPYIELFARCPLVTLALKTKPVTPVPGAHSASGEGVRGVAEPRLALLGGGGVTRASNAECGAGGSVSAQPWEKSVGPFHGTAPAFRSVSMWSLLMLALLLLRGCMIAAWEV